MTPPPLRLDNVTLSRGGRTVARNLSGVFAPGSLTAVTGPNGCGKSTLLQTLAGVLPLTAGRISHAPDIALPDIALLAQEGRLDRGFPINCRDVVALGATARLGYFRDIGGALAGDAQAALAAVGLPRFGDRPIGALSAGQFQRVLFARALLRDAAIILLDEPFSAVDAATEAALMDVVHAWHAEGRTIIAVLHDLDLIRAEFPNTLLLGSDPPIWGPTEQVLPRRRTRERVVNAQAAA